MHVTARISTVHLLCPTHDCLVRTLPCLFLARLALRGSTWSAYQEPDEDKLDGHARSIGRLLDTVKSAMRDRVSSCGLTVACAAHCENAASDILGQEAEMTMLGPACNFRSRSGRLSFGSVAQVGREGLLGRHGTLNAAASRGRRGLGSAGMSNAVREMKREEGGRRR